MADDNSHEQELEAALTMLAASYQPELFVKVARKVAHGIEARRLNRIIELFVQDVRRHEDHGKT